ncbi:MAG TPA: gluconate 2-dehydrogenase subunit 3 family protein [Kofleriaceae bacterium]|nr:gluconate 2-dehydrogenase subunit 3 family protein [Kofleriaceae bacterium]
MLTRRELIRLLGGAAALAQLPACGDNAGDRVFTASELAMLDKLADVVIPPDDQPGGSALGAVAYIERLITAFNQAMPPIYASGPFSDRNPNGDGTFPDNDFATFVELDRVNDAAWRLFVLGSAGLPDGGPNDALLGPIASLKDQIKQGLAAARDIHVSDPAELFNGLDPDFRALFIELVTEAAFAAPEYGGNPELAGWDMIHFEGDSQPRGYSQWNGSGYDERPGEPMSTPNPFDPEPLSDDIHQLLDTVVAVLGGKSSS